MCDYYLWSLLHARFYISFGLLPVRKSVILSTHVSAFISQNSTVKPYPVNSFFIMPSFCRWFICFCTTSFYSSFITYGWTKNVTLLCNFKCTSTRGYILILSHKQKASWYSSTRSYNFLFCSFVSLQYLSLFLFYVFVMSFLSSVSNQGYFPSLVVLLVSLINVLVLGVASGDFSFRVNFL